MTSSDGHNFIERVSLLISSENVIVEISFNALLDTGSPSCFIQAKYVPTIFINIPNHNQSFVGLNGSSVRVIGFIGCSILFRGQVSSVELHVVEDGTMKDAAILGRSFMNPNKLQLVKTSSFLLNQAVNEICNINLSGDNKEFEYEINDQIPINLQNKLHTLIGEYANLSTRPSVLTSAIKCSIKLTKNEQFYCVPRRLSHHDKEKVKVILDSLLAENIIRPSQSTYSSPIVLVKKKNGNVRMCVDYRTLNKLSERDNYPLPLIEDQLDLLHGKTFFSCLDLANGFYHVDMSEESVPLTSFVTPFGQYEFLKMPFGLKIAPSVFQRYINYLFRSLIDANKIMVYMDDLMIATSTLEEHINILNEVFEVINRHGLKLRLTKCKFFLQEVDYLGYRVNFNGIKPNPENLEAVRGFPIPKNIRDVHSFLGLCSYFRKFIKNFAIIAKPLYDLLRKNAVFVFNESEIEVFEFLKKCLVSSPVLAIYSPLDETELHCDASAIGFGAILMQRKSDNKFHPIFYYSKRTTDAESRYHSFELETLAIVNALKRFRVYLEGIPFKVITDCNSLALTLKKKQINPRIARWCLEFENFNYQIEHRPNQRMTHVDSLSRIPEEICVIEPTTMEQILAVEQARDKTISDIRKSLEDGTSLSSQFELQEGLVYRKVVEKLLFYVPAVLESNVIRTSHDDVGHLGTDKVYDLIIKAYWFPGLRKKIRDHIRNCLQCIQFSPNSGKIEGTLHSIPKVNVPFHTLHIDHVGPLSTTNLKQKHIFVIVDGFTKFIKLYPVRTTNSKEAVNCLTSYFAAYSRPVRIISDSGTAFTSAEFANFLLHHNVTHTKVATASPQSNGQVERFNRMVIPLLAKITNEDDWNKQLGLAEFAINNTKNRSINNTPSMLLFGVDQRGKVADKIKEYLMLSNIQERNLIEIRDKAAERIAKTQEENQATYNSVHKSPHKYNIDDLVMVANYDSTPGINKKLLPKYRGPYRIASVLPNDRYIVTDVENWQVTQRPYKGTHAPAQMRPWVQPS